MLGSTDSPAAQRPMDAGSSHIHMKQGTGFRSPTESSLVGTFYRSVPRRYFHIQQIIWPFKS